MKQLTVDEYIIKEAENALRMAANILESRKRETAADRSIEYAERLLNWVLAGQIESERPRVIPTAAEKGRQLQQTDTKERENNHKINNARQV